MKKFILACLLGVLVVEAATGPTIYIQRQGSYVLVQMAAKRAWLCELQSSPDGTNKWSTISRRAFSEDEFTTWAVPMTKTQAFFRVVLLDQNCCGY